MPRVPLADPYVKLELILRGRRLKKRKTEMRKRTLNAVFNESHIFDVPNADLQQVVLLVTVLDYDRCAVADAVPSGFTLTSLFSKREESSPEFWQLEGSLSHQVACT